MRRLAVSLFLFVTSTHAFADRAVRYRLGATLDPGEQRVFGSLEVTVRNTTPAALDAAYLWLYPNALREAPGGLDETNWYFVYPVELDAGGIRVTDVRRDGSPARATRPAPPRSPRGPGSASLRRPGDPAPGTLLRVALEPALPPGRTTVLSMRFETRVPERFGLFGIAGDRMTLASPFFPMLAALGPDGFDLEAPPDDADYDVLLTVPADREVLVNGTLAASVSRRTWRRVAWRGVAPGLAVLTYPALDTARTRHLGVTLEYLSEEPRYRSPERRPAEAMSTGPIPERLPDWVFIDEPALGLEAMRDAIEILDAVGLPVPRGETVRVVEAPMRLRLASETPGAVLVSDRIFRILPFDRTRRFHSLELLRAIFAEQALHRLGDLQAPRDRYWVADAIATALVEVYVVREAGGADSARELLGFAAFHPAVDQFLYAPQIAFAETYFATVEEPDPLREETWRFANRFPRGRRILAKLRDLLAPEAYERFLRSVLAGRASFREAAGRASGRDLEPFFATWLGEYPSVNYRLAGTRSWRVPDGSWQNEVVVERQGARIAEPVSVAVTDEAGERHDLVWSGEGDRGRLRFASQGSIDRVAVDPGGRLVEDPALTENHPRFDNLDPAPWRPPILNSAAVNVSVLEAQPDLVVDFSARRQYDLRHSLGFGFASTARGLGGNVRYFRGFGGKRNLNTLEWFAGGVLAVDRLSSSFADFGQPGTALGLFGIVYHDSRRFIWDPWNGSSLSIGLGPSFTILDDGETNVSGSAGVRLSQLWTPAPGRTFAFFVGGGLGVGELRPHEEQTVAGRHLLRAYEADEARGRARVYGIAEYRHTLTKSLGWNVVHFVWFRGLQLVGFAAAGLVTPDEDLARLFATESTYTEAGGGLRFHFDFFGVQPGLMAVDVAVPLSRTVFDWVDDCALRDGDVCTARRQPWALRISFDQTL